jgi:hypothetical protein
MWRLALPLVVVFVAGCSESRSPAAPMTPDAPGEEPDLVRQLASGGYVLFFRHAERNVTIMSTEALAIADNQGACFPGSELTQKGGRHLGTMRGDDRDKYRCLRRLRAALR